MTQDDRARPGGAGKEGGVVAGSEATLELRPYQREAVDAIHAAADRAVQRALVALPTGTGKTVAFAHLIPEARLT